LLRGNKKCQKKLGRTIGRRFIIPEIQNKSYFSGSLMKMAVKNPPGNRKKTGNFLVDSEKGR
jgi:hypothetical protein